MTLVLATIWEENGSARCRLSADGHTIISADRTVTSTKTVKLARCGASAVAGFAGRDRELDRYREIFERSGFEGIPPGWDVDSLVIQPAHQDIPYWMAHTNSHYQKDCRQFRIYVPSKLGMPSGFEWSCGGIYALFGQFGKMRELLGGRKQGETLKIARPENPGKLHEDLFRQLSDGFAIGPEYMRYSLAAETWEGPIFLY